MDRPSLQQPMEDTRGGRAELVGSPERRRQRAILPADLPVVSGSLFPPFPQFSSSVSPIPLQQGGVIDLRCDACCVLHGSQPLGQKRFDPSDTEYIHIVLL